MNIEKMQPFILKNNLQKLRINKKEDKLVKKKQ